MSTALQTVLAKQLPLETVWVLCEFLNIPKRQHVLKTVISKMETTTSRHEKLTQLCATSWLERYRPNSVAAVVELYGPIIAALQDICE